MIEIENFQKLNNNFFSFIYTLEDITYRSGVLFVEPITDAYFAEMFPSIQNTLFWLEQNVSNLAKQVEDNLPNGANVNIFRQQHIISFSLFFEKNDVIPTIKLAYGNDNGETYIIAQIKNKQINTVELNC